MIFFPTYIDIELFFSRRSKQSINSHDDLVFLIINIYNKYMYLLHLLLLLHSLRDNFFFKTNQCCMRIRFQKHLLLHNFYHNFIRKDPKKNQRAISAILLFHLLSLVWVFPCEDKKQVFRRCKIFFHLKGECKIHVEVSWQQAIRINQRRTRGLLCLN